MISNKNMGPLYYQISKLAISSPTIYFIKIIDNHFILGGKDIKGVPIKELHPGFSDKLNSTNYQHRFGYTKTLKKNEND